MGLLHAAGRLPPPPITATNCIDEKFRFLHDQKTLDPYLIAVGSSVTWRNLNFAALDSSTRQRLRPVNAAPCYLDIEETGQLTRFMVDRYDNVRTVLTVVAMRDFQQCTGDRFFSRGLLSGYLDRTVPSALIYLRNFRPKNFLKDVLHIRGMRDGSDIQNPLVMDPYGSGPLRIAEPDPRHDVVIDPQCFRQLADLAGWLHHRHIRMVVVTMPDMPAWIDRYDPGAVRSNAWRSQLRYLADQGAFKLLDGNRYRHDPRFVDPAHFHWSETAGFTRWLSQKGAFAPTALAMHE
ncbi:hypothetical protein [Stakelama sediminis]|uniref:hypothetical protein n=1 Tax=Stakelama sediminis TaxID=463200 RepID=UPI001608F512|nr:hypothetical protein [Stakelama sediminis]